MTWLSDPTPPRDITTNGCPFCHGTGEVETRESDSRVTTYETCPRCGARAPQRRAYVCLTMPQVTRLWDEFAALDDATDDREVDAAAALAEFFNGIFVMGQACERQRRARR